VGCARIAALVTFIAAVAHAHAFAQDGAPASLGATFQALVETAADIEVEPPEPETWFPVRGTIEFGEYDARFGAWRGSRRHEGQDVFADAGAPLVAIRDGTIVETGDDGGRGNYVAMWSRQARRTFVYLHMLRPSRVRVGARVRAGQSVGAVGCTGSCWGDHLHIEVRRGRGTTGRALDPLPQLRRLAARRARPE
jgi:murein DD-endopeptidase MepM/ murein hydrolase activator NlpD